MSDAPSGCPSAEVLAAFVRRELDPRQAEAIGAHAQGCAACAQVLFQHQGAQERSGPVATAATRAEPGAAARAEGSKEERTSVQPDAAEVAALREASDGELARGAQVGRYVLIDKLGEGGMGVVFSAYDPELDRRVAIKLLQSERREGSQSGGQARLLREAQAMAKLSHPNVVPVYDVGTHLERVWMAMELVEGDNLRDWMKQQPRSWREVLAVYLSAGRGLGAAHRAGLIHRDFKPDNVLLGKDGRVRVMDFGLARQASAGVELASGSAGPASSAEASGSHTPLSAPLTQAGLIVGTPVYMAPEQFVGLPADERTDQFSFAVALYETLFGERPFAGRPTPQNQATHWVLRERPRQSEVPTWVRAVVLRALSVVPAERYPTVDALLAALEADPSVRRRRAAAWASGALALALVGVGYWRVSTHQAQLCRGGEQRVAAVWSSEAKERIREAFVRSGRPFALDAFSGASRLLEGYLSGWSAAHAEACQATRIRQEQTEEVMTLRMECLDRRFAEARALTELLARADGELVEKALQAAEALSPLEACGDLEALRAKVKPPRDAQTAQAVAALQGELSSAKVLVDAGRYAEAVEVAPKLVERARALGYRPALVEALLLEGSLRVTRSEPKLAQPLLDEALFAAEGERQDEEALRAGVRLVDAEVSVQDPKAARHWLKHVTASLERQGKPGRQEAMALTASAEIDRLEGNLEQALALHQRAFELRKQVFGADHTETLRSQTNLGRMMTRVGGKDREAKKLFEEAAARFEALLGPMHPETADAVYSLATVAMLLQQSEEARRHFLRALEVREKVLGPDHPTVARTLNGLGFIAYDDGQLEEAIGYFRRALTVYEAKQGPTHLNVALALNSIGSAERELGRYQDSVRSLQRALSIRQLQGKDHPDTVGTYQDLGDTYRALGNTAEAIAHHQRGMAIARAKLAGDSVGELHVSLAQDYLATRRYPAALGHFKEALELLEEAYGPEDGQLVAPLAGIAEAQLELGAASEARAPLERALKLVDTAQLAKVRRAEERFALARALLRLDRARAEEALKLASASRQELAGMGRPTAEIEAWLARAGK